MGLEFKSDNFCWNLLGNVEEVNLTRIERGILKVLESNNNSVRSKDIEKELKGLGIGDSTVRCTLSRMIERELIKKVDTGLYELP